MSDTPLTDEQFRVFPNTSAGYVPIEFARKLERNFNIVEKVAEEQTITILKLQRELEKLKSEKTKFKKSSFLDEMHRVVGDHDKRFTPQEIIDKCIETQDEKFAMKFAMQVIYTMSSRYYDEAYFQEIKTIEPKK